MMSDLEPMLANASLKMSIITDNDREYLLTNINSYYHNNTEPNDWKILGYCVVGGQVELYFDNDDGHPSGQDINGGTLNLDKEFILKMLSDLEGKK